MLACVKHHLVGWVCLAWIGLAACGDDGPPVTPPSEGPTCGNGVVDPDEQCERLVGCTGDQSCTAQCACEVVPGPPPTSQDLIEKALAAGTIDYPTSLEYRVWALFNAPELPDAYDGAGNAGEDTSLFIELSRVQGQLPAAIAAAIAPYLVRPNDPLSMYSIPPASMFAAGDPPPVGCPPDASNNPDWRPYATTNFVTWSCGGGVSGTDDLATARMITGDLAEEVYAVLVPKLKEIKPDNLPVGPARTDRTDIYVLTPNQCRKRAGLCIPVGGDALAAAVVARPCDMDAGGTTTTSAYLIIDSRQVPAVAPGTSPSELRATMAHEVFHAITYNLNFGAIGGSCVGGPGLPPLDRGSWLVEASAEWASASFFKQDDPARRTYFFGRFQKLRPNYEYGLLSMWAKDHPYAAFLYPFFINEEGNDKPDVFLSFWNGVAAARTIVDLDNRLNSIFPFSEHFREFTVRNFNRDLPGDPIAFAHVGSDSALPFTEEYAAKVLQPVLVFAGPVSDLASKLDIAPLAMQLERYQLQPVVRFFRIDASTVGNGSHLAMDAIVKIKGVWSRRRIAGQVFEFCRDNEADDIDELYLVYSNFDHARTGTMDGNFRITSKLACPGGWNGTIKLVQKLDEHSNETQAAGTSIYDRHKRDEQVWTVSGTRLVTMPGYPPGYETETIDTLWHGSVSIDESSMFIESCGNNPTTTVGADEHSSVTSFGAFPSGTGVFTIQAIAPGTSYMIDTVSTGQQCGAPTVTTMGQELSVEALGVLAQIPEFAALTEKPGEPGHFVGKVTYLHDVQARPGGEQIIDHTLEWDLTRKPLAPQ